MAVTDPLCHSFLDLWWHFDPAAATLAGEPDHDGRLGAFDPITVRAHVAALRSIAAAVEDLEVEETADEIDRTALLDHLRVLIYRFDREHPFERNPALWIEHLAIAFDGLLARPPGAAEVADAALDRLRALPRFLGDARATVRRPCPFLLETAQALLAGVSESLEHAAERFGGAWSREPGAGPAALTDAHSALELTRSAWRKLSTDPDPHAAAIGEDSVDWRMHYEHASIHNAAEVWRGALRLASEVEAEVTALAAAVDPQVPWRELAESLREECPVWPELADAVRESLHHAQGFAAFRGLASESPELGVAPLSPAALVLEPVASYRPAGATLPAALLLGEPDRSAVPWLAARLGVPGVHLHRSSTAALDTLVRRHILATGIPKGWSLYAEELLVELGFRDDPVDRLMQRVLLLRDVHLAVVDLGLHTKQLTATEAVDHLAGRLPIDRGTALADVRRLACRPTSACGAILGWQELRRLRHDVARLRAAGFSLDAFHHELFDYGGQPVPLIRWGMGLDA